MLWQGLLLALAVSVDGFVVGVHYGMRKVTLPLRSLAVLAMCTAGGMAISMYVGDLVAGVLSQTFARRFGGLVLIVLGVWQGLAVWSHRMRVLGEAGGEEGFPLMKVRIPSMGVIIQVMTDPLRADADQSGEIDAREAIVLGVALGLDTLAVGFAAGMLEFGALLVALVAFALLGLVQAGVRFGQTIAQRFASPKWMYAPALLLIVLGLAHL